MRQTRIQKASQDRARRAAYEAQDRQTDTVLLAAQATVHRARRVSREADRFLADTPED